MIHSIRWRARAALCFLALTISRPAWAGADFDDMLRDLRCARATIAIIGQGDCPQEERSIVVAGSIAMLRYTRALKEEFEKNSGDLSVSYGGGNSISSLIAVNRRAVDIAAISRELKPKEQSIDLRTVLIGRDGVAVVAHPANPIGNLSRLEVEEMFMGTQPTWPGQNGQPVLPVHVFVREENSATRQSFTELALEGNDVTSAAEIMSSAEDLMAAVAKTPGAIGYVALHDVNAKVKLLSVDGVPMSDSTILSGRYPYARPLYYVTKGAPSPLEGRFIEFAVSPEGQAIIEQVGALRVR